MTSSFPRTACYDPEWIRRNSLGQNPLVQAEALCQVLPLAPGMRVLDLGCGNAISSIFLARELGVEVWAIDPDVDPAANRRRAANAGVAGAVFPLRADARALPFPRGFFDAAVAIDSYHYYGTDEHYLPYLVSFLGPGGLVGVTDIGFTRELEGVSEAPDFLAATFLEHWSFVHSPGWWRRFWERTSLVTVLVAEPLGTSAEILNSYVCDRAGRGEGDEITRAVPLDREGLITLFRLAAKKP